MTGKKIKVLVVDDSVFFRDYLSRAFALDPVIQIVGSAADAFEAERLLSELRPDVVALDMEMPKMRGAQFIRTILMTKYPWAKAIVISGIPNNVFEALQAGAVDFVSKPNTRPGFDNAAFIKEAADKIKIASRSVAMPGIRPPAAAPSGAARPPVSGARPPILKPILISSNPKAVVAIGASTGGTEAIVNVLKELPANMPGIVMVQHMPPVFTAMYAERLNKICKMEVKEAQDGDRVVQGVALLAAGDRQMQLMRDPRGYYVKCGGTEKVSGHCPSVDVLFNSVSKQAGRSAVGVILTGMGADGAKGLLEMKKSGAHTIGQDEATCVVYGMPMVSFNIGAVREQLPLGEIPGAVIRSLNGKPI
ncbi:MAG: chemotaxis response regulator protein-glutamate methylesterase [Oscillospiraceae bacterium]|nr:chemotaxis response regulator protein-glutamate methylesterase [Oscillospiraceae bacterium]